jgi:hypothetical protein
MPLNLADHCRHFSTRPGMRPSALWLATLLAAATPASAQTLDTLFSFSGLTGRNPYAGVTLDAAGNLFGTTNTGAGYGTVFRLSPDGLGGYNYSTLLSLNVGTGIYPMGGVTLDPAGNLFANTVTGGAGGGGTVLRLSPNGLGGYSHTTIMNFAGANGRNPYGSPALDSAGNVFGTTNLGGANNNGSVFRLSPDGLGGYNHTTLLSFTGVNGASPTSGPIVDTHGNIFGTTYVGARIFRLSPDGIGGYNHSTLFSSSASNGEGPNGRLTLDGAGNLFGTMSANNGFVRGTVFRLSPDGFGGYTHSRLFAFNDFATGVTPNAGVILDAVGNIFGTTTRGGSFDGGTIYRLSPDGFGGYTHTTLLSFNGSTGIYPYGELGRVDKLSEEDSPDTVRCDSKLTSVKEVSLGPGSVERRRMGLLRAFCH